MVKTSMLKLTLVISSLGIILCAIACNNGSTNTSSIPPFFPVLKEPETVYPDALAWGTLVLEDNCLRLKSHSPFGDSSLLIWPYGYTLIIDGNEIHVVDNHGQVVANLGDSIKVGGGRTTLEVVEKYIGETLPDNCTGPYWLVSGVTTD